MPAIVQVVFHDVCTNMWGPFEMETQKDLVFGIRLFRGSDKDRWRIALDTLNHGSTFRRGERWTWESLEINRILKYKISEVGYKVFTIAMWKCALSVYMCLS